MTGSDNVATRARLAGLYDAMLAVFNGAGLAPMDVLSQDEYIREWARSVGVPYLVGQMLRNPECVSPADLVEWTEWPHRDTWLKIMAEGTELWEGRGPYTRAETDVEGAEGPG